MSHAYKLGFDDPMDVLVDRVSAIVTQISGNTLGEKQKNMVRNRLNSRMIELKFDNPMDYNDYLNSNLDRESGILVSLLTTHHTFFFREFIHFEHLKKALPGLVEQVKKDGRRKIKVWSAACSRGQEVYSLAMFLDFHLKRIDPTMDYEILGSDIDPKSVKIAENGVYHRKEIAEAPMTYIGNHWARGTGEIRDYVKAKKSLTEKVSFKTINLLEIGRSLSLEKFDVVFCRNVFIYFEMTKINSIVKGVMSRLEKHGLLYSGISESLAQVDYKLFSFGPSVYGHILEQKAGEPTSAPVIKLPIAPKEAVGPIKLLLVDDSPSILKLLSKIFEKDKGFEVVATAKNGIEAHEALRKHDVDIMTLDIHMPELDGISYLEKYYNSMHPPVVMISSASRDDSTLAIKSLDLGATDFVEKPALNNLKERGEEIKNKIRVAHSDFASHEGASKVDYDFGKEVVVNNAENKLNLIVANLSDRKKFETVIGNWKHHSPPVILIFEGHENLIPSLPEELSKNIFKPVHIFEENMKLEVGHVYVADFSGNYSKILAQYRFSPTTIMVLGRPSTISTEALSEWTGAHLMVEDLNDGNKTGVCEFASDICPHTSFAYMSDLYLSKK